MTLTDNINTLTAQYNDAIQALVDSYNMESQSTQLMSTTKLKMQYSKQYEALVGEYRGKCNEQMQMWEQNHPEWAKRRKMLGWLFIIGILASFVCCCASLPTEEETSTVSTLVSQEHTQAWNADNIPIPYLQDSTQYVSNPDSVLTQQAVDRMNVTLQKLNLELGDQSVVIVVNNIENDDPFRFAQDVGNKYGVGYQDKGLVVVVGYMDHSINMSPGRALEADLTDAECHRLEQQYVVPAMRAEMPDSGMIYFTEAIYSTLKKKELPQMSSLLSESDDDSGIMGSLGLTFLFLLTWCIYYLKLNKKYMWMGLTSAIPLLANPFFVAETHHSSGGGFGGFGGGSIGGSGGGFSGGHFGGGSFGGGGATSRW